MAALMDFVVVGVGLVVTALQVISIVESRRTRRAVEALFGAQADEALAATTAFERPESNAVAASDPSLIAAGLGRRPEPARERHSDRPPPHKRTSLLEVQPRRGG